MVLHTWEHMVPSLPVWYGDPIETARGAVVLGIGTVDTVGLHPGVAVSGTESVGAGGVKPENKPGS